MTQSTDKRAEYVAGLRALADILDAKPDLPLPFASGGIVDPITFGWSALTVSEPVAEMARIRSLIGVGRWDKNSPDSPHTGSYYKLTAHLHGVDLEITAFRSAVCERVVTGIREVTRTVPAPNAPTVKVTEIVEDVEWVCAPLLAQVSS